MMMMMNTLMMMMMIRNLLYRRIFKYITFCIVEYVRFNFPFPFFFFERLLCLCITWATSLTSLLTRKIWEIIFSLFPFQNIQSNLTSPKKISTRYYPYIFSELLPQCIVTVRLPRFPIGWMDVFVFPFFSQITLSLLCYDYKTFLASMVVSKHINDNESKTNCSHFSHTKFFWKETGVD